MDGLTLLREAEEAGLSVSLHGEQLVVRGPRRAEAVARRLLAHKSEIVYAIRCLGQLLSRGTEVAHAAMTATITLDNLPWDWRCEWLERAAIREFEGGQAREHAEAEALREVVQRMGLVGNSDVPVAGCGGREEL